MIPGLGPARAFSLVLTLAGAVVATTGPSDAGGEGEDRIGLADLAAYRMLLSPAPRPPRRRPAERTRFLASASATSGIDRSRIAAVGSRSPAGSATVPPGGDRQLPAAGRGLDLLRGRRPCLPSSILRPTTPSPPGRAGLSIHGYFFEDHPLCRRGRRSPCALIVGDRPPGPAAPVADGRGVPAGRAATLAGGRDAPTAAPRPDQPGRSFNLALAVVLAVLVLVAIAVQMLRGHGSGTGRTVGVAAPIANDPIPPPIRRLPQQGRRMRPRCINRRREARKGLQRARPRKTMSKDLGIRMPGHRELRRRTRQRVDLILGREIPR